MGMKKNEIPATITMNSKKANSKKGASIQSLEEIVSDHPIMNILNKKLRALKKKQEKIKNLEMAVRDGKKLNDQQQDVLENRSSVEKLASEFTNLRIQFAQLIHQERQSTQKEETTTKETVENGEEESSSSEEEKEKEKEEMKLMESNENSFEEEENEIPSIMKPASSSIEVSTDVLASNKMDGVEKLLRLLHVVSMHQALGKSIPKELDFFVKVLMGRTRPPAELSFDENLSESLEEAKRFLNLSEKTVVCDLSYRQLQDLVDELTRPKSIESTVDIPASEPEINFFVDVQPTNEMESNSTIMDSYESANGIEEIMKSESIQPTKLSSFEENGSINAHEHSSVARYTPTSVGANPDERPILSSSIPTEVPKEKSKSFADIAASGLPTESNLNSAEINSQNKNQSHPQSQSQQQPRRVRHRPRRSNQQGDSIEKSKRNGGRQRDSREENKTKEGGQNGQSGGRKNGRYRGNRNPRGSSSFPDTNIPSNPGKN